LLRRMGLKGISAIFFLAGAAWVQTAATKGDLPLPLPTATVKIRDIGPADAPARCIGTANAYVKPQPNDEIMTWVEETNLSVKNVSDKDILKVVVKLTLLDVRGNSTDHVWELYTPNVILEPGKRRGIGRGRHWSGARPTISQAEYNSRPEVKPTVDCHVGSVFFTDGSAWPVGAVWPEPPPE
jgi:hypothetical protein